MHDVGAEARRGGAQRQPGARVVAEATLEGNRREPALREPGRERTAGMRCDQDLVARIAQVRREREHLGLAATEAALRIDVQDAQAHQQSSVRTRRLTSSLPCGRASSRAHLSVNARLHDRPLSRRKRSSCFAYLRCTYTAADTATKSPGLPSRKPELHR